MLTSAASLYVVYKYANLSTSVIRPGWKNKLAPEDKRALNLLFHSHINPYGLFPLDVEKRLGITADSIKTSDEDPPDIALEEIEEKDLA